MMRIKKNAIVTDNPERFWDVCDIISGGDSGVAFKNGATYTRNGAKRVHIFKYNGKVVVGVSVIESPTGAYVVKYYNEADAEFGYDPGVQTLNSNLTRDVAKSIVRHLRKNAPSFCLYWMEAEPERWV